MKNENVDNKVAVSPSVPLICSADALSENAERLTPEQIQHWRNIVPTLFAISSAFLSDEDIQKLRDRFQKAADNL